MKNVKLKMRLWAKRAAYGTVLRPMMSIVDIVDGGYRRATGKPVLPPRRLLMDVSGQRLVHFWKDGDYDSAGRHFLEIFQRVCNLKPDERVLEIGCGVGRIASALTTYLNEKGRYVGVDVMYDAINWCNKHIAKRYRHFAFHHCNVYNGRYNPSAQDVIILEK